MLHLARNVLTKETLETMALYSGKVLTWPVTLMRACICQIAVTLTCSPRQTEKVGDSLTCFDFRLIIMWVVKSGMKLSMECPCWVISPHRQEGTVSLCVSWVPANFGLAVAPRWWCETCMAVNREERVLLFSTCFTWVSHLRSDSRSFRVGITFCSVL